MKYILTLILMGATFVCFAGKVPDVEKWGTFEITLKLPAKIKQDEKIKLQAIFKSGQDSIKMNGFYDGGRVYKIRFMPVKTGLWEYTINSSVKDFCKKGSINCIAPGSKNHGMVCARDTYYFSYSDSTVFSPLGTTIYRYTEQADSVREATLNALKDAPFNKVRIKVLGPYAGGDPVKVPFEKLGQGFNYSKPNPEFFKITDETIRNLQDLGIEVDFIFIHPYDREVQDLRNMTKEQIYSYLDYIISRYSAYRNVWWTTNEFDLLDNLKTEDWDDIFRYLQVNDPYHHLRSNHNSLVWYDHKKPWITHASVQSESWWDAKMLRDRYKKPIIFDEFCYEGFGNNRTVALSGEVITHRCWLMLINGAYATHGEAIENRFGKLFFSEGGNLTGQSYKQLKILKKIIDEAPGVIKPLANDWRLFHIFAGCDDRYLIYYLGDYQNKTWEFSELKDNTSYKAEIIDTRTEEIQKYQGIITKNSQIALPGKAYCALRLVKLNN